MNKLKFNFKKSLLILFITILGVFTTTGIIQAATGNSGVGKSFLTSAGHDVIVPEIEVNNEKGYCLNFDLSFPTGQEYKTIKDVYDNEPTLRGALFYGFGGADNSLQAKWGIPDEQASYATNIVIWRHAHDLGIPSNSGSFRNLALKSNAHPNLLDYLEELATKELDPIQPITVAFNGTTRVENGKQVSDWITLSNQVPYEVEVYNGATLEVKEANRFKISVPTYFSGNVAVKVKPTVRNFQPLVWRTSSNAQDIVQLDGKDPLPAVDVNVNFKVLSAHIEVLKEDEKGNVVPGVVFEQSTTPDFSSDVWEVTTGENGIGKDTWNRGDITVYVREKSVPKHLVKSAEVKKVQLKTNETTRIKFTNKIVRGNIEILKVDGEDSNKKLQGAVFELKQGNTLIQTQTTNAQGIASFKGIPYGKYTISEKAQPNGYRLNPAVLNVTVDKHNQTYKFDFKNFKIKGNIEILKVDFEDQNKVLPGVTFALFKDGAEIATSTTNAQGIARFENVEYGDYVVREKATLEHYALSNEFKNVAIKNHNEVIKFTMTNNKIYGEIEVLKVAEHDNNLKLPGAVFELRKDGKVIDTQTTNKDGIARFKKVEYGDVEIVEVKAPEGYFLSKDNTRKAKVEVQKQVISFTAINEAQPTIQTQAHGEGQKVREAVEPKDKQIITETAQLKDLVVGESYKILLELVDLVTKKVVQTKEVEFIATATTMTISENFEVNGFEFNEGVTFSEDLYRKNQKGEWELKATHNKTYDDADQTVKFKKYGKLIVKKVDANDKTTVLEGAEFTLYRDGKEIAKGISGKDGIVVFEKLIEGVEYELKETNAPVGYLLPKESKKIILTAEQLEKEEIFEVPNSLLPIIKKEVESGDASNHFVFALVALISLVGVFGLRRKEDRD